MNLGARAENLISEFASKQGVRGLAFDENDLIPIRLDGKLDIALGYSPANDAIFVFGIVAEHVDAERFDPWVAFERNQSLVERRTRLSLNEGSTLVLSADAYLEGLSYPQFASILDRFVADLEAEISAFGALGMTSGAPQAPTLPPEDGDAVIMRL
ncbi:MAG: type III secretion system chaperone [Pseudomonadota bacterium]